MMASCEELVDTKVILFARIRDIRIKHCVAIPKEWTLQHAQSDRERDIRFGRVSPQLDSPLDDRTLTVLQNARTKRHHFELSTQRFLVPSLLDRSYREVSARQPRVTLLLLEALRLQAHAERRNAIAMLFCGRNVHVEELVADAVRRRHPAFPSFPSRPQYICFGVCAWFEVRQL